MDKLKMMTADGVEGNIEKIEALFPCCVTERLNEKGKVEKAIDFEKLKQELSHVVVDGAEERYQFTWPDKKKSILLANAPINKTLRPVVCDEQVPTGADSSGQPYISSGSVGKNGEAGGFDSENLYIEGDNLDVLKLLQETYMGRIKMIYIDPPYNTGNDFVYEDDFSMRNAEFSMLNEDVDEDGNRMVLNAESNGRFHTDWLNMIYPRLKLAKELLTNDGVIFISIDDNEQANLKKVCDEVFGASNFVNQFCWLNNLKGRQISNFGAVKTYETILCYAKSFINVALFQGQVGCLKESMPSAYKGFNYETQKDERGLYVIKNELYNTNSIFNEQTRPNLVYNIHYNPITKEIKFSSISEDINFDGYVKIVPKKNNNGTHKFQAWRWSQKKVIDESYDLEFIKFENTYKIYTKIRDFNLTNIKDIITDISNGNSEMIQLFGTASIFSYPKSTDLIKLFISCLCDNDDIILDFFSGSATTAHAVMQLNAEDGGNRKFIMAQLPEITDEKSEAFKAGYKNICEIGKERIRRAGKKIAQQFSAVSDGGQSNMLDNSSTTNHYPLTPNHSTGKGVAVSDGGQSNMLDNSSTTNHYPLTPNHSTGKGVVVSDGGQSNMLDNSSTTNHYPLTPNHSNLDIGFRVLKLDTTNMKDVYYRAENYSQGLLDNLEGNIKTDRKPQDLLLQVMLDMGVMLSSKIEEKNFTMQNGQCVMVNAQGATLDEQSNSLTTNSYPLTTNSYPLTTNYTVFIVGDYSSNIQPNLIACFDDNLSNELVTAIAKMKPLYAVFRDSSFANDSVATNFEQIFTTYSPTTIRKVL